MQRTSAEQEITKIKDLTPNSIGVHARVRVIRTQVVLQAPDPLRPGRNLQLAEVLVGDETGSVVFMADDRFLDFMSPGSPLLIRHAHVEMCGGFIRLAVGRWGSVVLSAEQAPVDVNESENVSSLEYAKMEHTQTMAGGHSLATLSY